MDPPIDLEDWEFLNESDHPILNLNPDPKPLVTLEEEEEEEEEVAFKSDYFSLNPIIKPQHETETDENPSRWVGPDSISLILDPSRDQLDLSGYKSCSGICSDELSDCANESEEVEVEKEEENDVKDENLENQNQNQRDWWWRMPLEVVKVWVLRARPVWSISVMAAIVGVVMLGRKLYKMKQRARGIPIPPLKIAFDDKKASQFKARVSRLNEAFSVVKHVPAIKPSLPAAALTSCPMASLR